MRSARTRLLPLGLAAAAAVALVSSSPALAGPSARTSPHATHGRSAMVRPGGNGTGTLSGARHSVPGTRGGESARRAAGRSDARFAELRGRLQGSKQAGTAHDDWGIFPNDVASGAFAVQSIDTKLSIPESETFYTPTLLAGRTGCFEITTIYSGNSRQLGAWNWCADKPGFDKTVNLDDGFASTYTGLLNGRPSYSVQVNQTDAAANEWTAYLYNYKTKKWDTFYSSKGKTHLSGNDTGWDMWEIYTSVDGNNNGAYCSAVKGHSFESSHQQFWINGGWHPTDSGNVHWSPSQQPDPGRDFHCSGLTFTGNPNDWVVAG